MKKRQYIKPEIEKIVLDSNISLMMDSTDPPALPAANDNNKGSDPFASPFGDKPFN